MAQLSFEPYNGSHNGYSEEEKNLDLSLINYHFKFQQIFPANDYPSLLKGNGYDVSIKGYQRLADFVNECIDKNEPVPIPEGYFDRIY